MKLFSKKNAVLSVVALSTVFLFSFKVKTENYGKSKLLVENQKPLLVSENSKPNITGIVARTAKVAVETARLLLGSAESNNHSKVSEIEKQTKLENLD